jgi:hypothetical protein
MFLQPTRSKFVLFVQQIESTNLQIEKLSLFNVYLSNGQKKSLFFTTHTLQTVCEGKKYCHRLKFLRLLVICWEFSQPQCPLQSFSVSVVPLTRIWQFHVFSPVSTHLGPFTPTPVVHFKISHSATTPTTPRTSDPSHPINCHASA